MDSAMPEKAWKVAERRLAAIFGTVRRALSGGNSKTGRDDAMHSRLFIECKCRKCMPIMRLFEETKKLAVQEKKIPVLGLHENRKPGFLICCHSSDLPAVLKEYAKANGYVLLKPTRKK